jgi:exopolyphosphatase/guanosine-5'-triphosphate,3'-diphosphate pyrophosphatase
MVKAAIGIGSNAIRMLAAECGGVRCIPIKRFREDVRPFEGLAAGKLTREMIGRIGETVAAFHTIAVNDYHAEQVVLVATSACRDASNSDELAELIYKKCGLHLRVITGEEEARYSFIGASNAVNSDAMIDIGGGSTEVAARLGEDIRSASLQLGAVRLLTCDFSVEEMANMFRLNAGFIESDMRIAGVGGTITTLAKMRGNPLSVATVEDVLAELESKTVEERYQIKGLPRKRADVIVPGCRILLAFMRAFDVPCVYATDCGNLDGVLLMRN